MSGNGCFQFFVGFFWDLSLIELYSFGLGSEEGFADSVGCEMSKKLSLCEMCALYKTQMMHEGGKPKEFIY